MFGWLFGSDCPLEPHPKNWIEDRLLWLSDQFGAEHLSSCPLILPTPKYFPDPYDGSRKAVRVLFERACGYMGVTPGLIRLDFLTPPENPLYLVNAGGEALPTDAAGLYAGRVIYVNENEMSYPMALIGTLAHELAHERLLGEERIDPESYDHELLTDLTTVFMGMGIFLANSPRHWDGDYTFWPGTELRKPTYMTGAMFGYALALLAWVRNEHRPAWARYVFPGVRSELRQGLRFLLKTGDAKLRPLVKHN